MVYKTWYLSTLILKLNICADVFIYGYKLRSKGNGYMLEWHWRKINKYLPHPPPSFIKNKLCTLDLQQEAHHLHQPGRIREQKEDDTSNPTKSEKNYLVILLNSLCVSNKFKWPGDLSHPIHVHIKVNSWNGVER